MRTPYTMGIGPRAMQAFAAGGSAAAHDRVGGAAGPGSRRRARMGFFPNSMQRSKIRKLSVTVSHPVTVSHHQARGSTRIRLR
jgi:hypothetical protein